MTSKLYRKITLERVTHSGERDYMRQEFTKEYSFYDFSLKGNLILYYKITTLNNASQALTQQIIFRVSNVLVGVPYSSTADWA